MGEPGRTALIRAVFVSVAIACLLSTGGPVTHIVDGQPVVVVAPDGGGPYPVVFLIAGLGELKRGDRASAAGWVEKYGLIEGLAAIERGHFTEADFGGLVQGPLFDLYQRRRRAGYGGLVFVGLPAPVTWDRRFERRVMDVFVPWAEATLPVKKGYAFRGVDGISLGGRHALRLAVAHPGQFRSVGTEQASVKGLLPSFIRQRSVLTAASPSIFNLLTSTRDGYRRDIGTFARELAALGLPVRRREVPGGHDKRFAKGPGVLDMILFHDAVLNATVPWHTY